MIQLEYILVKKQYENNMAFQKGHSFGFKKGEPRNPGPGRPKSPEKVISSLMTIAEARYLTDQELNTAMKAAATLMCSDFNYFKFLMERQEKAVESAKVKSSFPKLKTVSDVSDVAFKVGEQMLEEKIEPKKAREMTEVLKNISELNLSPEIEKMEDMTGKE